MTEMMEKHVELIFPEMMVHPVLFTHPNPKKIVLLGENTDLILHEALKHTNILEIYVIASKSEQFVDNNRVFYVELSSLKTNSMDIIINASDLNETKLFFELLQKDGILIQQSVSPFATHALKTLTHTLRQTCFNDLQLLSFPQPNYTTGWRSILMALKHGMFKRLREKIIYNRPFKTSYYNFDVHKAATVLPEFIKNSNLF